MKCIPHPWAPFQIGRRDDTGTGRTMFYVRDPHTGADVAVKDSYSEAEAEALRLSTTMKGSNHAS